MSQQMAWVIEHSLFRLFRNTHTHIFTTHTHTHQPYKWPPAVSVFPFDPSSYQSCSYGCCPQCLHFDWGSAQALLLSVAFLLGGELSRCPSPATKRQRSLGSWGAFEEMVYVGTHLESTCGRLPHRVTPSLLQQS